MNSMAEWRKSSYSDGGQGNCLEVRDGVSGAVPVRDSKVAGGPVLTVSAPAWSAFVRLVAR
ncbi:DUF397 domain-containing protein [Streptomyces sp. DSM 44915]|uniref:DUF397 domain-containing protein n=1 Tax=Streptomyces chisholmiae TaxID=3075540 RepID=A0ABU2JT02_9ACTN|nr:DUF397 domain-containing protein [Streptomyces sp. DSM 44915]MDT0268126.1 DUF397 domain-containing protein [Streptomyces sp. DSM 44915]